jgi:hypothetical protein
MQVASMSDRRRHSRFPLGLPVKVHLDGRADPITVELMDIAEGGVRFRAGRDEVRVDQTAAFGFVVPDQRACVAKGRVVRVEGTGEFVLVLEQSNEAFRGFVESLSDEG